MAENLVNTPEVQGLLDKLSGQDQAAGDARLKAVIRRIMGDLFATIDEFDLTDNEVWGALNYAAAGSGEFGLWAAGLGLERYLDIRADAIDAGHGVTGGTPRTIEGPLYVAGAPETQGFARLDDGADDGKGEVLIMHGQVRDVAGKPLANAKVEVWHANTLGNYSYFDQTQSAFNLRRTIYADSEGRYAFRSIVPVGYACPPGGSTEGILKAIGRHGNRPAHIHFFISAHGHRHLTTQINIEGDPYLHDDFAYATRDDLIPPVNHAGNGDLGAKYGVSDPFAEIEFDFVLQAATDAAEEDASTRQRAAA
ncbi:catechol 1,2-dioxygenase [Novosphingobium album (ex Liu et al. 2023)]|uniref:catechol 1,2-dioxygenase n=1 Tax=Novosphingobium album (ex Liu et al. 2023) TaxID=3031130 RepID=A0ABT5WRV2_9SPHN|nr:catechol 1,2-dioxygenase [Novosphingobium album (ex Liu et al. 2023)]MDE8652771.1 catechol 1,2-dioxygenase [Novosphingobium album (ex Liu et al. 2023)]